MSTFEEAETHVKIFHENNAKHIPYEIFKEEYKKNIDTLETLHDVHRIGNITVDNIYIDKTFIKCPHCEHPNEFENDELITDGHDMYRTCSSCDKDFKVWAKIEFCTEKIE